MKDMLGFIGLCIVVLLLGSGLHEFILWKFEDEPENFTRPLYVMLVCTSLMMCMLESRIKKLENRLEEKDD